MLGKALETLFIRVWVVMKLTFYFWIYTLMGAIVLGIGPAYKTVNEGWKHLNKHLSVGMCCLVYF